jgi:hypothetical protein
MRCQGWKITIAQLTHHGFRSGSQIVVFFPKLTTPTAEQPRKLSSTASLASPATVENVIKALNLWGGKNFCKHLDCQYYCQ